MAFAAGLTAQEFGKTALMIEERLIGETCANRGCLPSKNLIEAARIVHDARNPRYPGLARAESDFDFAQLIAQLIAQDDELVHDYRTKSMRH